MTWRLTRDGCSHRIIHIEHQDGIVVVLTIGRKEPMTDPIPVRFLRDGRKQVRAAAEAGDLCIVPKLPLGAHTAPVPDNAVRGTCL